MARVFICYSRKDSAFVGQLAADLRAAGVPIWRDIDDIPHDVRSNTTGWRDAVDRGLRDSSHMLVILSPDSVASEEVKAEWNYFLSQRRTVYPVLHRECEIPYRLFALNYYDFKGDYGVALAALISALPTGDSSPVSATRVNRPSARTLGMVGAALAVILVIAAALILTTQTGASGAHGTDSSTTGTPTNGVQLVETSLVTEGSTTPAVTADPLIIAANNLTHLALLPPLTGHTDFVRSVQWSPDGLRVASASRDGTVILWTVDTGEKQTLSNHTGWVNDVVWSPSMGQGDAGGLRLLSAGADSRIVEWDTTNGRKIRAFKDQTGAIYALAWSPDGKMTASGAEDNTAIIRSSGSGTTLQTLEVEGPVYAVAWSPDSTRLATSGPGSDILIWDAASGKIQQTLKGHTGAVYALSWSRANGMLASASADHSVILWNMDTGTEVWALIGHTDVVYGVAWSPDGSLLASVSADHAMIVWLAADGSPLRRVIGHEGPVTSISWSPDGKRIATGSWDNNIALWQISP